MGRVAEALVDELGHISRLTGQPEEEVHREWKEAARTGKTFGQFAVIKSRKKAKKERLH